MAFECALGYLARKGSRKAGDGDHSLFFPCLTDREAQGQRDLVRGRAGSSTVCSPSPGLLFFPSRSSEPSLFCRILEAALLINRRLVSMGILVHLQDPWLDGGKGEGTGKSAPGRKGGSDQPLEARLHLKL